MRKTVVNCSIGKTTTVDMDEQEVLKWQAEVTEAARPNPLTIEQRLSALEAQISAIINQGVK